MYKLDLKDKDYKILGGFIVFTDTNEVYAQNGKLMGKLPKGDFPQSVPEMFHLMSGSEEKIEEIKPKPKPKPKKKATLKSRKTSWH